MSNIEEDTDAQSQREIAIVRILRAPRSLVFQAWTDPKHIAQWWGPKGFTTRVIEMDVRPGGKWRYVMTGPEGVPGQRCFSRNRTL